jgi:hypothetical protein
MSLKPSRHRYFFEKNYEKVIIFYIVGQLLLHYKLKVSMTLCDSLKPTKQAQLVFKL